MNMETFPSTHTEAIQRNNARYADYIASGRYAPNIYPLDSLMLLIPFVYMVLPRRYNSELVRYIALAATSIAASYHIFFTRAKHASTSGLVGILNAFAIMLTVAHVGLIDPKKEHARIISVDSNTSTSDGKIVEQAPTGTSGPEGRTASNRIGIASSRTYRWQTFPDSIPSRFDWAIDLLTNLDGAGWEWAVPSVSAPPARVQKALAQSKHSPNIDTRAIEKKWSRLRQNEEVLTSSDVLREALRQFCIGYIIIDVLKTLICNDPWFWGQLDAPPPPYLPAFLRFPFAIRGLRLLIGQGCVHLAIQNVLVLRTVIYLLPAYRDRIGVRGEAWVHSSPFGSFQAVLDRGLLGFWSEYWHQAFRYVFTAPTRAIVRKSGIHPQSIPAQLIRLFMAFFLSGILHASISFTSLGPSYPIRPFLFFMAQPFGIIAQIVFSYLFFQLPLAKKLPKWVRQGSNLGWVLLYGYLTGPLLIEDFARGGSLLLQAVPLSPLRGLGLGREGDGFLCWRGGWFTWHWNGIWSFVEV